MIRAVWEWVRDGHRLGRDLGHRHHERGRLGEEGAAPCPKTFYTPSHKGLKELTAKRHLFRAK